MATTTTRLGLRKPAGSDNVNVTTDISDSMDKIDLAVGYEVLTAFPVSPYTGKLVLRSDQGNRGYVWNGTSWLITHNGPYADLRGTGTSITDSVQTAVPFTTEIVDTDNGHDNAVNNTRYTFPFDGVYAVTARVGWAASATVATLEIALRTNGSTSYIGDRGSTSANVIYVQNMTKHLDVNSGDYVELLVTTTGVTRNLTTSGGIPAMDITFIRSS